MAASDSYSAAGQAGLAIKIQGLREAKRAFQALPQVTREAMLGAVDTTARDMAGSAKRRLLSSPSVLTRSLLNAVAFRVTPTNGRAKVGITSGSHVGYVTMPSGQQRRKKLKGYMHGGGPKPRLIRPDYYARFVEFGTRNMKAEPFMLPSAEEQKRPFAERCRAAGREIERSASASSGLL